MNYSDGHVGVHRDRFIPSTAKVDICALDIIATYLSTRSAGDVVAAAFQENPLASHPREERVSHFSRHCFHRKFSCSYEERCELGGSNPLSHRTLRTTCHVIRLHRSRIPDTFHRIGEKNPLDVEFPKSATYQNFMSRHHRLSSTCLKMRLNNAVTY